MVIVKTKTESKALKVTWMNTVKKMMTSVAVR